MRFDDILLFQRLIAVSLRVAGASVGELCTERLLFTILMHTVVPYSEKRHAYVADIEPDHDRTRVSANFPDLLLYHFTDNQIAPPTIII